MMKSRIIGFKKVNSLVNSPSYSYVIHLNVSNHSHIVVPL